MAALTGSIIGGITAGIGVIQGERQRRQGQRALDDFERQELTNAFETVPISTFGSDLIQENSGIAAASATNVAQQAGIRGVLGALPRIQAQQNRDAQAAASLIDQQVIGRNRAIAQDNVNIRSIQENRDNQDLAGIGNQINVGRQQTQAGIIGLANAGFSALNTPRDNKVDDGLSDSDRKLADIRNQPITF